MLFIFLWIISSCQPTNQEEKFAKGHANYDIDKKELVYTVEAKTNFCIATDCYFTVKDYTDSVFLIAYDTVSNIDYNGFPEPKIECAKPNEKLSGKISGFYPNTDFGGYKCFMRVYKKSFKDYLKEKKIIWIEASEFLSFENEYGEVIELVFTQSQDGFK